MLWYLWKLSRRNILLLSMLCIAVTFLIRRIAGGTPDASFAYVNFVGQVFLIALLGGCLFLWRWESSFLPHSSLFTLPLSTTRYLILFYGYVLAIVGAASCAAAALHFHLFGGTLSTLVRDGMELGFWQMPLACVALACLIQSLFHLAGIKNELRAVPMAIALQVMAVVCLLPVLEPGDSSLQHIRYAPLPALLLAWGCSHHALASHRSGRLHGRMVILLEWFGRGQGRTATFVSPDRALFWLGWRRYGHLLPLWSLGLGLTSLALIGGSELFWQDQLFRGIDRGGPFIVYYLGTLPAVACATILSHIFILIRTREDLFGTGRGYFLALPVRSAGLSRGRLLAMTLSVSVVLAAELALFAPVLYYTPVLMNPDTIFTMLLAPLLVWLVLWFGLLLAGAYLVFIFALVCLAVLLQPAGGNQLEGYGLVVLATMSIVTMALFLFRGIRRGLLSRTDWGLFAAVLVGCLAVTAFFAWPEPAHLRGPIQNLLIAVLALGAVLPIALPFVVAPVMTDWIRHR
jgi:hypothetical protein